MPTPEDIAQARAVLRRHGLNLEGACWWCGRDVPFPCPLYTAAQATLAKAALAVGEPGAGGVTAAEDRAGTPTAAGPGAGRATAADVAADDTGVAGAGEATGPDTGASDPTVAEVEAAGGGR